jgi:hypothetical protein
MKNAGCVDAVLALVSSSGIGDRMQCRADLFNAMKWRHLVAAMRYSFQHWLPSRFLDEIHLVEASDRNAALSDCAKGGVGKPRAVQWQPIRHAP